MKNWVSTVSMSSPSSPLYKSLPNNQIMCLACQHRCLIDDGRLGHCRVRGNSNGKLILPTYGRYTIAVDPIEKKPLYHFLPGSRVYSYGTVGCNFSCQFCQNSSLSMWKLDLEDVASIEESDIGRLEEVTPELIVNNAIRKQCASIASTYNEPTVTSEFSYEVFKLAKSKGLFTVYVTNGFESVETLEYLAPYLDAVNIDLKGWSEQFYSRICGGSREGVCKTIRRCVAMGIHTEVTTLVIPQENDSNEELSSIAQFLVSVDPEIVWHLSAYHDDYKFSGRGLTPLSTLQRAAKIGYSSGLKYIYLGNVHSEEARITKCPNCHKVLIQRNWGSFVNHMKNGTCECGTSIPGLFSDANHLKEKLIKCPDELRDEIEKPNEIHLSQNNMIVFATQQGRSKSIAEALGEKLHFPVINITDVNANMIFNCNVVFVLSTYGRGGPPKDAIKFWGEIQNQTQKFEGTKFAVIGCGSTDFQKTFCGFAKSFEEKMILLGATEVVPLETVDANEEIPINDIGTSIKFD